MDKVEKRHCLNCGEELHGGYCSNCGQIDKPIRDFRLILGEFFSNFSLFDNRMMISLKYLLFAPGYLTNEYIEGRRVRYSSPLRMYLLISAFYFAVLAYTKSNTFFGTITIESDASEGLRVWLPRLMFFMIPYFALLMKLLFIKKKRYYYEHLIYSLHYHSFYFITIMGMAMLRYFAGTDNLDFRTSPWWVILIDGVLQFLPFLYMILSMKKVYRCSAIRAILYTLLIPIIQLSLLIAAGSIAERIW